MLVVASLGRHQRDRFGRDVRRIHHQQVHSPAKRQRQGGVQVALVDRAAHRFDVAASAVHRRRVHIRGMQLDVLQAASQRDADRSRSAAEIDHDDGGWPSRNGQPTREARCDAEARTPPAPRRSADRRTRPSQGSAPAVARPHADRPSTRAEPASPHRRSAAEPRPRRTRIQPAEAAERSLPRPRTGPLAPGLRRPSGFRGLRRTAMPGAHVVVARTRAAAWSTRIHNASTGLSTTKRCASKAWYFRRYRWRPLRSMNGRSNQTPASENRSPSDPSPTRKQLRKRREGQRHAPAASLPGPVDHREHHQFLGPVRGGAPAPRDIERELAPLVC